MQEQEKSLDPKATIESGNRTDAEIGVKFVDQQVATYRKELWNMGMHFTSPGVHE